MMSWNKEQGDEKKDLSGLLVMARSVSCDGLTPDEASGSA